MHLPPQMIMLSDLSIKLLITSTLSDIFAPPTIEVKGVFLSSGSNTLEKASSSLATRSPDTHGIFPLSPTILEWAL